MGILTTLLPCQSGSGESAFSPIDPKNLVMRLFIAYAEGDAAQVSNSTAEGAVWIYHGPEHILPYAGVYEGRPGVAAFFKAAGEALSEHHAVARQYLVKDGQVIVSGLEEGTVRATGGQYRVAMVQRYDVRDSNIVRFEEVADSGGIVEAFMPADPERGKALYTSCAGCHGDWAQGRPEMHAPCLVGLGAGYVTRQLRLFRDALRGRSDDTYGFMMVGRAGALPADRGLRDVAAYIDTLSTSRQPGSADHERTRGRALYAACAPCHGENAEGSTATGAPPLRQLDDVYLMRQLRNFRTGVRGAAPLDAAGQQMRLAARSLSSDAAISDVVLYIKTR
jgi:cytochrome c553